MTEKIKYFAQVLERDQIARLREQHLDCEANVKNARVTVSEGRKYTKVDVGTSGKYMVDMATGRIHAIKAYGVIHKAKTFGTLDTVDEYFWGEYHAFRKAGA